MQMLTIDTKATKVNKYQQMLRYDLDKFPQFLSNDNKFEKSPTDVSKCLQMGTNVNNC